MGVVIPTSGHGHKLALCFCAVTQGIGILPGYKCSLVWSGGMRSMYVLAIILQFEGFEVSGAFPSGDVGPGTASKGTPIHVLNRTVTVCASQLCTAALR